MEVPTGTDPQQSYSQATGKWFSVKYLQVSHRYMVFSEIFTGKSQVHGFQ